MAACAKCGRAVFESDLDLDDLCCFCALGVVDKSDASIVEASVDDTPITTEGADDQGQ
jgi:hypothetical protein